MVRSEVYLNKYYVVSIAPLSTTACPDYSQNIHKTAFFACSRFLIFHPFFQGWGSVDPICPYVRTPVIHGINFFHSESSIGSDLTELWSRVCGRTFLAHPVQ